jgi:hypothetical protein
MSKETRYTTIQDLILKGYISSLTEIFEKELISRSKVARDLGLNPARFTRNLHHPERFILKDLYALAALIGIENMTILQLANTDYEANQKKSKKKKG